MAPIWSPDGERVAYSIWNSILEIRVGQVGLETTLHQDDDPVYPTSWSPDGGSGRGAVWMLSLDEACQWDCGAIDGVVDTVDFLTLLSQWGHIGVSCDFDNNGVDTIDFLALLAAWGACP